MALDNALTHFNLFSEHYKNDDSRYTAPLVRLVQYDKSEAMKREDLRSYTSNATLAEDWPWWTVAEYAAVKPEIQADPRWKEWVSKLEK